MPDAQPTEERREQRLRLLEDDIGRALAAAESSGELRAAPSYGRPLNLQDGYEQTPAELRMGYKLLKDAGVLPPEVQLMRDIDNLQGRIERAEGSEAELVTARQQLLAMRQQLALRLERLRMTGSL